MENNVLKQSKLISLFVCCEEESEYLDEFFDCLLRQTYDNFEVIFIDNCSDDDSYEKALRYKEALYKRNVFLYVDKIKRKNTADAIYGMCGREAEGDYRMNITPQCFFKENALWEIAKAFDDNKCGAVVVNDNRCIWENYGGAVDGKNIAKSILSGSDIPDGFCAYRFDLVSKVSSFYRSTVYFGNTQRVYYAACVSDIFVMKDNIYEKKVPVPEYNLERFFDQYMFLQNACDKAKLFDIQDGEECMAEGINKLAGMAVDKAKCLKKEKSEEAVRYEYLSKVFAG